MAMGRSTPGEHEQCLHSKEPHQQKGGISNPPVARDEGLSCSEGANMLS